MPDSSPQHPACTHNRCSSQDLGHPPAARLSRTVLCPLIGRARPPRLTPAGQRVAIPVATDLLPRVTDPIAAAPGRASRLGPRRRSPAGTPAADRPGPGGNSATIVKNIANWPSRATNPSVARVVGGRPWAVGPAWPSLRGSRGVMTGLDSATVGTRTFGRMMARGLYTDPVQCIMPAGAGDAVPGAVPSPAAASQPASPPTTGPGDR